MPSFSSGRATQLFRRNIAAQRIQGAYRARNRRAPPRAIQKKTHRLPATAAYKLSRPMKALVNKAIDASKPDHWGMVWAGNSNCRYAADAASGGSLISLIPSIQTAGYDAGTLVSDIQVNNLNSREGKTVKLKSIRGKLNVYFKPETVPLSGPGGTDLLSSVYVRVLTLSAKNRPTFKQVTTDWIGILQPHLFLDNNTKAYSWQGAPEQVYQPVNRQLFTVHQDQTVLLHRGSLYQDLIGSAVDQYVMAHMPSMGHVFNINVKCKNKTLNYDQVSDLYPSNFAPFVVVLYSSMTQSSSAAIQNTAVKQGSFKMTYED